MDDKVKRALRLINMGISEDFCKIWIDYCRSNLEWNNRDRNSIKDMVSKEYELYVNNRAETRRGELIDNFNKEKKNER